MALCSWLVSIIVLHFLSGPLLPSSSSIHSNSRKKKAIAAGRPKKEKLGSTSLFIHFPLQIQQAFSQLSFSLTTAMALDTAASLSFLLLCLKIMSTVWKEGNLSQGKIHPERTLRPFSRAQSIFVTINSIIPRLETGKLLYWQQGDYDFVEYLL